MIQLGYACINMTLGKEGISTNRSMIKKTFMQKGIEYAGELALKNVLDLEEIIHWNIKNDIFLYRMSSDVFPWASEYSIESLPQYLDIKYVLQMIGETATKHGVRIGCHPGPFNVLCSPNPQVVQNTFKDLETHAQIFDMMGLSQTPYNKINIHCNGTYGDKIASMQRFCDNFDKLSDSVKSRLTVENDDKASMYTVKDLMYIHEKIGIPIAQMPEDRHAVTRKLGAFKTSMLQDVEAGKAVELDALVSVVRELGQITQVSTPYTDALLGLSRLHARVHGLYPAEWAHDWNIEIAHDHGLRHLIADRVHDGCQPCGSPARV